MTSSKIYFPTMISATLLAAMAGSAVGQDIVEEQVVPKIDVCSVKYLNEADTYYENRLHRDTGQQAQTRYKEILEKCPDNLFHAEIETKILRMEEERAEHLFMIAMYYRERQMQTGSGGLGARSRLQQIVDKMPRYSRISEVKIWLEEIKSMLPAEID